MIFPFIKNDERPFMCVRFEFSGDSCGSGAISVISEGAGAFVEIKTDDPLRLGVADLQHLYAWSRDACALLNKYNGEDDLGQKPEEVEE